MEKRYQVFISSTYIDLKDERQIVSRSILDLGHIPVGMEIFPATNANQLDYIKKIIDDCDYYILIIGGRYGSSDVTGISYTEQEFEYAKSKGIPILAFPHGSPGDILLKNSEIDDMQRKNLDRFVDNVKNGRIVKFWNDPQGLSASVITSLTSEIRDNPRVGWRRATDEISPKIQKEINDAKSSRDYWISQYNKTNEQLKSYKNLEETEVSIKYYGNDGPATLNMSGEQLIRELAPALMSSITDEELTEILVTYIRHHCDPMIETIDRRSADLVRLFLTVFEIATVNEYDNKLEIVEKNKFLLQAAFKPLKKVLEARSDYDDEIPF